MAGKGGIPTKLFIGNLPIGCDQRELYNLFAKYGKVLECDIIKDYAFVHFADPNEAKQAVENLDQYRFKGVNIKVQLSHSRVRPKPGMGLRDKCYRCGAEGHWSKECPADSGSTSRGGGGPMFNSRRNFAGRDSDGGAENYMMGAMRHSAVAAYAGEDGRGNGGFSSGYSLSVADAAAAPPMVPVRYHPYATSERRPAPAPAPSSMYPSAYPTTMRSMTDEYGRPTPEYYAMRSAVRGTYDYGSAAGRVPLAAAASTMYPLAAARRSPPRY
jgi:RNA-binding protein 4